MRIIRLLSIAVLRAFIGYAKQFGERSETMATQKQLVAVVADVMGVPLETVTVIDRLLAEAGMRTRALRGRGQTLMTYQDAANLVIATALDVSPRNAVQLVAAYSELAAYRVTEYAKYDPEGLGLGFGLALARVIEQVAIDRVDFSASERAPNHKAATVRLHGPTPRAEIALFLDGEVLTYEYGPMFAGTGDLRRTVQFTQVTLGLVGEAIATGLDK
jgi:hypothetical protein